MTHPPPEYYAFAVAVTRDNDPGLALFELYFLRKHCKRIVGIKTGAMGSCRRRGAQTSGTNLRRCFDRLVSTNVLSMFDDVMDRARAAEIINSTGAGWPRKDAKAFGEMLQAVAVPMLWNGVSGVQSAVACGCNPAPSALHGREESWLDLKTWIQQYMIAFLAAFLRGCLCLQSFSFFLSGCLCLQSCFNGNWELSMIEGMMGIGVFTENRTLFDHSVDMWKARVPTPPSNDDIPATQTPQENDTCEWDQ